MSCTLTPVEEFSTIDHQDSEPRRLPKPVAPVDNVGSASLIRACLLPLALGLVLRALVAFCWLENTEPYNDGADYLAEATKLSQGTREAIPFYWPPGTSYYLAGWFAGFGASITVARLAIVVLSTTQVAIAFGLTYQATGQRRIAVLAAYLWAIYPPAVFLVSQPYSQHLAGLSLAAIAWCGIKWMKSNSLTWLMALGLCLGVGCLTRPSMASVLLITMFSIAIVEMSRPVRWWSRIVAACRNAALICLAAGIVIGPSLLHNARTGGGYTLSTNNERNFFLGNNPHTPWYKTSHFAQRPLAELSPEVQEYLTSHYAAPNRREFMKAAAIQHILQNPGLAILRTVNRARSFWGFDYLASRVVQATSHPPRIVSMLVLLAEAGGYCAIMLAAFVALTRHSNGINRTAKFWYLAVIVAYAGPYCIAFASGTYHFPVMGVMIPFAAIGFDALRQGSWKADLRSWSLWTVALLFVAMQIEYAYFTLAAGVTAV